VTGDGTPALQTALEIASYLSSNPFPNRNSHTIPDHSIRIVGAAGECEPYTVREYARLQGVPDSQPRAQVFGVMRDAGGCDISTFWIADGRSVSVFTGETSVHIIRNVRSWLGLKNLSECDCSLSPRFTPSKVSSTADDDQSVLLLR
jgi:hypothetical protein